MAISKKKVGTVSQLKLLQTDTYPFSFSPHSVSIAAIEIHSKVCKFLILKKQVVRTIAFNYSKFESI
jgi:hypothetical protein